MHMRVVRHMDFGLLAFFIALIVLVAPVASAASMHVCCAPDSKTGMLVSQQNMSAHFQHNLMSNPTDTENQMQSKHPASDRLCDISCCSIAVSYAVPTPTVSVETKWNFDAKGFEPFGEIAFSAAQSINTPPPRVSINI